MKRVIFVMSLMAVCGLVLGACGGDDDGGPHCVKTSTLTCDPACTAGKVCCNLTCKDMATCDDPACVAPQYCDPCGGGCVDPAAECVPACEATEWCDDGTCKLLPVCDPVCAADETCVP